ncbi:MAG: OsmC family peroxiredoxin [Promethearchaeota archaeon]|nr:MAG: OsmC family peroxiredoxin [Candidatus Lokiarchaeota archaeon]
MAVFKLKISQTSEDLKSDNNRKRFNTISIPDNPSLPELKVQLPIAYEGPQGNNNKEIVYTPEHFFIMAVSGCFFTTFSVTASNSRMKYEKITIESKGYVGTSTGVKMMEKIEQVITLEIPKNVRERKALRVLEIAEKRCPLANSVKTKVNNTYNIKFFD